VKMSWCDDGEFGEYGDLDSGVMMVNMEVTITETECVKCNIK